jgi:C-terminal processing protease CtpA/Prc
MQIMRENSVNRLVIDWNAFTARVNQVAAGAQTILDTYPAITVALGLLNDHHSFFLPPPGVTARPINLTSLNCQTAAVPNASVPPDIGYVRVGAFSDATPGADVAFADLVQTQIRAQDRPALAGWIVDLRGNTGGNMWPMVAGVGPVLGEGVLGYFVYPTGATETWTYQAGLSSGSGVVSHVTAAYTLLQPSPRVAVLTNLAVASSGESVAVAFRGRPNTRTFGTATCGLSSSNSPFALSDGAVLYLNTAVDADRNHIVYGGALIPDETIAGDGEVVQRAISWLRSS